MNIITAARETFSHTGNMVDGSRSKTNKDHIKYMLKEIMLGNVTGEKAHRWLAWAQCAIYEHNRFVTLDTFKRINYKA